MRQSVAAVALITREREGRREWLAQWNSHWQRYNFVGGHKDEEESFRECIVRELFEELGLREGLDLTVGERPVAHLEYDDWSESARQETHYTIEVFAVELATDDARRKVSADVQNRWLTDEEVRARRSVDGKLVSGTMENLLNKMKDTQQGVLGGTSRRPGVPFPR